MTSSNTPSVPDSFSMDDLEKLRAQAPKESSNTSDESDESKSFSSYTDEQRRDMCSEAMNAVYKMCPDPAIHKLLALEVINTMVEYHNEVASKEDDSETRANWLRDAGKFQAVMNILFTISVSEDDSYIFPPENPE